MIQPIERREANRVATAAMYAADQLMRTATARRDLDEVDRIMERFERIADVCHRLHYGEQG